jgi:hypothetical protein
MNYTNDLRLLLGTQPGKVTAYINQHTLPFDKARMVAMWLAFGVNGFQAMNVILSSGRLSDAQRLEQWLETHSGSVPHEPIEDRRVVATQFDPLTGTAVEFAYAIDPQHSFVGTELNPKVLTGAKVGYDNPHLDGRESPHPHRSRQHISCQSAVKRKAGSASTRWDVGYEGAPHPSRPEFHVAKQAKLRLVA